MHKYHEQCKKIILDALGDVTEVAVSPVYERVRKANGEISFADFTQSMAKLHEDTVIEWSGQFYKLGADTKIEDKPKRASKPKRTRKPKVEKPKEAEKVEDKKTA